MYMDLDFSHVAGSVMSFLLEAASKSEMGVLTGYMVSDYRTRLHLERVASRQTEPCLLVPG